MRNAIRVLALAAMSLVAAGETEAQGRVSDMLSNCQFEAAKRLSGDVADTNVKYEGQRTDGTHAINGEIWVGGRTTRFQCSYAANGYDLVDFWTDARNGASIGAASSAGTHKVRFSAGADNTTVTGKLGSEQAARYVLGARNGQFLQVSLRPDNGLTYMIIYVPGGDILFESSQGGNEYYGQLYKSGDHVVEVFYKGDPGTFGNFDVYFEIR